MPAALTIPGVQVRTLFEPAPVLPGAAGILGVVGVADRGPLLPTPIGNVGELTELFGPASRYTMPEVRTAFANGIALAVIARIAPGRGTKASLDLLDDEGERVVRLEARAEGAWANRLGVGVRQVKTLSGRGVKYVDLEVSLDGQVIERFPNLNLDETSPDYLFDRINEQSRVLVAIDPLFEKGLPAEIAAMPLADAGARAASARLKAGAADVVVVEAKRPGRAGNRIGVRVLDGHAGLTLIGAGDAASVDVRARTPGSAGTAIRVAVTEGGSGAVNLVISPSAGPARTHGPFATVDEIVAGLAGDPDVLAEARGTVLPAVAGATNLGRRVVVEVIAEGRDTASYPDLADLAAIAAITDPLVTFAPVEAATQLPAADEAGVPLTGGRDRGPALQLAAGEGAPPLLELAPVAGVTAPLSVSLASATSTVDNATAVRNLAVLVDGEAVETFPNLTMDPDDPNYLPAVLESSRFLRAIDLFVRSRTTSLPRETTRPEPLKGGAAPLPDDFRDALDRLEAAEEVDLVIASVHGQLTDTEIRSVHQAVVAHCTKMETVARNRIGIGSVSRDETTSVPAILDHANDVRSDHFILAAPTGSEGAIAGLLGRQDYFESPTFKTIPSLDAAPGQYTDAELTQLVNGNVLVVNERRRLGIIAIKGVLTSGRQVNVQRTANKAVRDVKAIADRYIGLLNNDGTRNALQQQLVALLLQMERDGALVPSVDGADPAFRVAVYSTQADFANGIVRVDVAVRPVRAIDYVYATILVKN